MMGLVGLAMLLASAVAMAVSGLPAWIVLLGTALLFASAGVAAGAFGLSLLSALPLRLVGLLEHDLLQALPLYILIGVMFNRLPLVDILIRVGNRLMRRSAAAPYLTGMALGALLAPMNGSVGASVATLARALPPQLQARGASAERSAALICSASIIGVIVPPSLVLILLSDAMMQAHTVALNSTTLVGRIINTQDIFHAALRPGALLLLLFFALSWWCNRRAPAPAAQASDVVTPMPSKAEYLVAGAAVLCILALLGAVTLGYLYAVEGAATGGFLLLLFGLGTRSLSWVRLQAILRETMSVTGSLFVLLVAATSYTLVLRAFETDLWISDFLRGLGGGGTVALAVVLLVLAVSAFVLDAFEITFVVIPIVMPPLLMLVPDAAWVSVLTLLVLQLGFSLPPFGYAVLMTGSLVRRDLSYRKLSVALLPYLLAQLLVLLLVLAWPGMLA